MNVTRLDVDALSAVLKVEIAPVDYQGKVKNSLEKYRKTAKIPGFRPGHVPFALIQKQYGKSVLAEELNKIVNDSLYGFIESNKIEILGNPIPKVDSEVEGDFDKPDSFVFEFEIGLAPLFETPLSSSSKYDYIKVKVDDKLIDKQINDLTRRYGKLISVDSVAESDMILGQFVELNQDESIKEGGILHSSTISLEFISDSATKNLLLNKTVGEKIVVNPLSVSKGGKDTAAMLGISEDQLAGISDKFQFTVNEIKRMEPADLNQELFDRLFGHNAISSETELLKRITDDLTKMFAADSDRILTRTIYNDLIEKTNLDLPHSFLKRWIKLSNEKPISEEQLESEYDGYASHLKWQLIQGNIFKTNEVKFNNAEVVDFTKNLLVNNYAQYGIPAPDDRELTESANRVLKNRDEANRIYDMLAEHKLTEIFKNTVKLSDKEVSYEEFIEIASN